MKIIDISWPITPNITEYKQKKTVQFEQVKNFERDAVRDSNLCIGSHTGTHIDAPAHFIKDGKTIEQMDLSACVGACKVIDLQHIQEKITADDLQGYAIAGGDIILLKTSNSNCGPTDPFITNFVYLDATGAQYLADKKIKAVGIDYLGIERNQPDHATHVVLMQNHVTIIEGLRLAHVQSGTYTLYCLPLPVQGLEAAPARAILV